MTTDCVEVTLAEFLDYYDDYDAPHYDIPDLLNEGECQGPGRCGNPVGVHVHEWEDHAGREHAGEIWHATFRLPDGRYICEDCHANL